MTRATMSLAPPAGNETIQCTGRDGYLSACALIALAGSMAVLAVALRSARRVSRMTPSQPELVGGCSSAICWTKERTALTGVTATLQLKPYWRWGSHVARGFGSGGWQPPGPFCRQSHSSWVTCTLEALSGQGDISTVLEASS